ncbi:type VI secretion system accessory protein TagJ [Enterobacteriaceae bacterium LUAb1]
MNETAMSITTALKTSTLQDWIIQAIANVKATPGNIETRLQLFKLYCVDANWNKAMHQLETLFKLDPEFQRQGELYKNLLLSEKMREEVLTGKRSPGVLDGDLPAWVQLLQQANQKYAEEECVQGEALRQQALNDAEARAGRSEKQGEFSWLADGDERLGPICEFICAGGYRWVPFAEIDSLQVAEPKGIIDLVWAPAQIVVREQTWHGYLPARYPLNSESEDQLKLGLKTEWLHKEESRYEGQGQKMWMTSDGEYSLFEAGDIHFS